ncbi:TniQ family protein [Streptacidiphilus sp. EB103A]|uniref:TniQ family protein n=1 Tax=Streptacidiphilus sp. EB103A TaxID=3156275 RepID=UPI0035184D2E
MNPSPHPLPRTLVPLADESLPGFLLRLAHRLDLAPAQLIWRIGLGGSKPGRPTPAKHLLMLEAGQQKAFAEAAKITTADAEALTLFPFLERYPPLTRALVRQGSPARPRHLFPAGILITYSRFCPHCLIGDGSPVQNRFGGSWRRQWRLAVSFACMEHNVFLRHDCPACGLPAMSGQADSSPSLLPASPTPGLHPAQCRNRVITGERTGICGQRLDQAAPPATELTATMANLQRTLLDQLAASHPADRAFQQFADLHVLSAIIKAAWPSSLHLVPKELRPELAQHVAEQDSLALADWPHERNRGRKTAIAWSTPPTDARAQAGLLAAAERLASRPPAPHHDPLVPLLHKIEAQPNERWDDTWLVLARDSSPSLRQRIDHDYRLEFPALWVRRGAPDQWVAATHRSDALVEPVIAVRDRGFLAEHIPQSLPPAWLAHFAEHTGIPRHMSSLLKRVVPVQLVQSVTGEDFHEAARFLGIPTEWITEKPRVLHPIRLNSRWRDFDFPGAIDHLAEHIAAQDAPADFLARRRLFNDWQLEDRAWEQLRRLHRGKGPQPTDWTRDSASTLIWSRVTGSEYLLAPTFRGSPPASPSLSRTSTALRTLTHWDTRATSRQPNYPAIFEAAEALAVQIAEAADAHAQ